MDSKKDEQGKGAGIKTAIDTLFQMSSDIKNAKEEKSSNQQKEESEMTTSVTTALPPTGSRISSTVWANELKRDYDANVTLDPTIFSEEAKGENGSSATASRTESINTFMRRLDNELTTKDKDKKQTTSRVGSPPSSISHLLATANAIEQANSRMASYDVVKNLILGDAPTGNAAPPPSAAAPVGSYESVAAIVNSKPPSAPTAPGNGSTKQPKKSPARKRSNKNDIERVYVEEEDIKEDDVLCGRGGKSNHHIGNKRYRQVVCEMKNDYRGIDAKAEKTDLSREIVERVMEYGGRFLKKDPQKRWFLLTKNEARKKTSQALRETKVLKWLPENEEKGKKLQAIKKTEKQTVNATDAMQVTLVQSDQKAELQAVNATEV